MSVVTEGSASSAFPRRVALRPLALPSEHGGWSMLFEPIVLGILVAPSLAGSLIAAAAVLAFLARHPLRLFVQDARRRKRYARTVACAWLAVAYAGMSAIALISAVAMSGSRFLLPLVAGALLASIQFALDVRQRGRSFVAEICGACATATTAAAIATAAHRSWSVALPLALLAASLTLPAILFVRAVLRHERRTTTMVLHGAAVIGAAILWQRGLTPAVTIIVMAMLLVRAAIGLREKVAPPAKIIGMREAIVGAAAVLVIAAGYLS
ncbi:MAG TPA: YwiC-like family protein [Thermoanaerobaculia bacterium]|nr:YwiC-like family protein [Thermoanaerobaculia bacterium]